MGVNTSILPKKQKKSLVLSPVRKAARSRDRAAKLARGCACSLSAAGDTHTHNKKQKTKHPCKLKIFVCCERALKKKQSSKADNFTCKVCAQWSQHNNLPHLTWNMWRCIDCIQSHLPPRWPTVTSDRTDCWHTGEPRQQKKVLCLSNYSTFSHLGFLMTIGLYHVTHLSM